MSGIQLTSYKAVEELFELKFPILEELNGDKTTGIESIKFITGKGSYNYAKLNKLYVVGPGPKSSPGHPSAHHNELNQRMRTNSVKRGNRIHVFHENSANKITYLGIYGISRTIRKITEEGWVYSEMELEPLR